MRGFRRLAGLTITFTFILIVLGAVVRSTGSGLACPDWPQCYGLWLPTPETLEGLGAVDYSYGQVMLEWTHRLIAGVIVGPLVLILAIWSVRLRREAGSLPALMIVALLLVLIQAGLGGVTVLEGNIPWSVAVHLSVALTFLATLIFAFISSERQSGLGRVLDYVGLGARTLAAITLVVTLITVASGAITAKSGASFACGSWPLCDGLRLPDLSDLLVRIRYTESQINFSWRGRARNVSGAFALRPGRPVAGRRIILIDDVMTSGATVNACAKALKRAGAASVSVLTLARVVKLGD